MLLLLRLLQLLRLLWLLLLQIQLLCDASWRCCCRPAVSARPALVFQRRGVHCCCRQLLLLLGLRLR